MFTFLKSRFKKVKNALSKTRSALGERMSSLFGRPWDESTFESLEQILYEADLGSACVEDFVSYLKAQLRLKPKQTLEEILELLKTRAREILSAPVSHTGAEPEPNTPLAILVVGINGSGKTTSIAKLSLNYQKEGKSVLLGAADTFRAAAADQLSLWADKLSIDIVKSNPGADPSAVAFDALSAGQSRAKDIVLIDTAGRLQNKTDLMKELEKIQKTCKKVSAKAPHETYLVLDATHGQNALDQARTFHKFVPLTGIILTKLDGSAKGGIILSIYKELQIPIRWIGVGEGAEDLIAFDVDEYIEALFGTSS